MQVGKKKELIKKTDTLTAYDLFIFLIYSFIYEPM